MLKKTIFIGVATVCVATSVHAASEAACLKMYENPSTRNSSFPVMVNTKQCKDASYYEAMVQKNNKAASEKLQKQKAEELAQKKQRRLAHEKARNEFIAQEKVATDIWIQKIGNSKAQTIINAFPKINGHRYCESVDDKYCTYLNDFYTDLDHKKYLSATSDASMLKVGYELQQELKPKKAEAIQGLLSANPSMRDDVVTAYEGMAYEMQRKHGSHFKGLSQRDFEVMNFYR